MTIKIVELQEEYSCKYNENLRFKYKTESLMILELIIYFYVVNRSHRLLIVDEAVT